MDAADVARSIFGGLLSDPALVDASTTDVVDWLATNTEQVDGHDVAWAAARSVQGALDAIDAGAVPKPATDEIEIFRSLPVAGRVIVSLAEFCRFTDEQVAAATARPLAEVTHFLDGIEASDDERASSATGAAPADDTSSATSAAPADDTVALPPPAATPRPATPSETVRAVKRTRRTTKRSQRPRWWMLVAGVVLALIAGGIVASNMRDDQPSTPVGARAGLADSASINRAQLSKGCATARGDVELAAQNINVGQPGGDRTYRLIAPAAIAAGRPRALLVDFSDLAQPVADHLTETRFDSLAAALKVVVVTVSASTAATQWDVTGAPDSGDAALVDTIISDVSERLCIDRTRVLLTGRGAGAHFAGAYACSRPKAVSGLVLVAGAYRPEDCPTKGRMSVLSVLGEQDKVYPITGGNGPEFAAVAAAAGPLIDGADYDPGAPPTALEDWARAMDCSGRATQEIGALTVRISTSCLKDGEVWRVVVPDAGHLWYPETYDLIVQFLTVGPFPTS